MQIKQNIMCCACHVGFEGIAVPRLLIIFISRNFVIIPEMYFIGWLHCLYKTWLLLFSAFYLYPCVYYAMTCTT
jgi:hypothetical protein